MSEVITAASGGLMDEQTGEKLMVVPLTADVFRAVVSALLSLDGKDGVNFNTFTIAEDPCVRLLVKKFGRGIPDSVVREELESLNIRVQGVTHLRSGRRDQDPAKNLPPTPLLYFEWREGLNCPMCDH